ncbi:hypothetical protein SprV_0802580100 [Sparganum proliferum]
MHDRRFFHIDGHFEVSDAGGEEVSAPSHVLFDCGVESTIAGEEQLVDCSRRQSRYGPHSPAVMQMPVSPVGDVDLGALIMESSIANQSIDSIEDCEPAPSSPAPKFSIGQTKPGGFQKISAFGQSLVYKSPSVTTSSERAEKEFSMRDFGNRKSPCLQKKTVDENLTEPEFTADEEDDKREGSQVHNTPKEILEERKIPSPSPSVDSASASNRLERVVGTRDLCELIKTQIELTRSTCTSTMQTCFKTRTVQKALETLLTTTFEDLRELRSFLTQKREENNTLVSRLEEAEQKHRSELVKSNSEKLTMSQQLEKVESMQNDRERDIQEQTSLLASHLQSIRLCSELYEESVSQDIRLRESLQGVINATEESVKCREKDLSQRIYEMKNEELAKSRQINELTVVIENFKGENEKLKTEIENDAKALRELDDAKRALDNTLMLSLQKQDEMKERLTVLEIRCKEQENTLAQENIKAVEQAAYVDKLLKKIENLEKEGTQIRTKLQETKNQAEFKNTKVEELESQLQERLRQLEELEDTIRINDTEKEEIQKSAQENLESVTRKEAENAQLTERLQLAEAERMAAIKRNDEIRAELLYAMEQQQQEMDKLLRLKDRELEGLRSTLATQQNDSEKTAKKTEKKIVESGNQIEKLTKQLKECTQEKKELSKQLNTKTQRVNKLEKENEQRANILKENEEALASLREELDSLRLNKEQLDEKVSAQERELQKLKKIEMEFKSFKHQVMENSPPASTQLPVEIETLVQQTPKSPLLSQRLNHLNLLKTPQKTPKGILKQPGSECKRRRVLLVSPERSASPPPRVETAVYDVIDLDDEPEPRSRPITPKIRRTPLVGGRMSSQTRNANLRKTPGSSIKGPADVKRREEMSAEGASWFDSDPIFGLANED